MENNNINALITEDIDDAIRLNTEESFNTIVMSYKSYLDLIFAILRNGYFYNGLSHKSKYRGFEIAIGKDFLEGMFLMERR